MKQFWQTKTLAELNKDEWESLCDGCGRCCLQKLENESSGEVHYTQLVCHLYDMDNVHVVTMRIVVYRLKIV